MSKKTPRIQTKKRFVDWFEWKKGDGSMPKMKYKTIDTDQASASVP